MRNMDNPQPPEGMINVEIEGLVYGGNGIAHHEKRAVFVPFTIPGEAVAARITATDRGVQAEGVRLLEASADRVIPECPHFGPGACSLCQWQHMHYEAQVLLKQDVFVDQLLHVGRFHESLLERTLKPIVRAPAAWGYNHHMTFTPLRADGKPLDEGIAPPARASDDESEDDAAIDVEDEMNAERLNALAPPDDPDAIDRLDDAAPVAAGALAFPTRERGWIAIEDCRIIHPSLMALANVVDLDLQGVKRVRLQLGSDGARMIILTLGEEDAPQLETDLPASINVLLPDNTPMNLIGDSHSRYDVSGHTFRVTAGSYYRANAAMVGTLQAAVLEALRPQEGERILDLFAGVGVFTAAIAPRVRLVTLVESYPPAVSDADENLSLFENVDVVEGGVEEVLASLIEDEERYDAAVIDPPSREQAVSEAALDGLDGLGVGRIVLVNDDPGVFAKLAGRLARRGWRLESVQPFDVAPQTFYTTGIARFVRGTAKPATDRREPPRRPR